jgi:phytoene synthase
MIHAGSKSFSAAGVFLPAKVRDAAYALYAFCRLSDDLVDLGDGTLDAIAQLRHRLGLAYEGRPADSCVDRAFADVILEFGIPRVLPEALIEGLEWDVRGVMHDGLNDVFAYAARVAGAVGAMMSVLMGVRDRDVVARACDLGVAMQLTNIARDVGEDAANGRLYLPRAWLRAEGVDPDSWLVAPRWQPEIGRVVERLLCEAEILYRRAESGIDRLPSACRPAIFAAHSLYAEIGAAVAQNHFDSLSSRAQVSKARKLILISRAMVRGVAFAGSKPVEKPPLDETRFLVDAVAASQGCVASNKRRGVSESIVWVAELFVAIDERKRGSSVGV